MPSGFNFSTQGLLARQRIDPSMQRLQQMASIPNTYFPTASRIQAMSEQDKQNDENATFIFEYRALLNSRLQQVITKLTNAFTSDLDGAMGLSGNDVALLGGDPGNWTTRPGMMGIGGDDPGAARATLTYFSQWGTATLGISPADEAYGDDTTDPKKGAGLGKAASFTFDADTTSGTSAEITAFDPITTDGVTYNLMSADAVSNGTTSLQGGLASADLLSAFRVFYDAGNVTGRSSNEFQRALIETFKKRDYHDILRWGMLADQGDAIYIAATTTSASGAQIQSTLKLEYIGDGGGGFITVRQDRWTAYYHS